jgi:SWI/SNF-related matrix-associated actin-dependent regulator 1 of chromatin subfamily A
MTIGDLNKASALLKNYSGFNTYLLWLKEAVFVKKTNTLTDMQVDYVIRNHSLVPQFLGKVVSVASWYGELMREKFKLEFTPKKVKIGYYLGETENCYHMYVRYRQSQEKLVLLFIPKSAILNPLFLEDFQKREVDFSKYNKEGFTLKPQQEMGVKFLVTRKKAILAHQMGGGKTATAIVAALEDGFEKILVICPASVKTNWFKEVNRFVDKDDITIVEGSKWKESRFTIINYDILDNFYEIPTEVVKRREKYVDDYGKIRYRYVEKEVVSKKNVVISEAMMNSQLYQSKFDLIIIDEAHRLSNNKSGRYKIISDLLDRSRPRGVYELTGTMITNNPMNLYHILKLIDAPITKDWQSYVKNYCDGKQIYVKSERDKLSYGFIKRKGKNSWYDLTYDEKKELDAYLDKNCKKIWITSGSSNLDELRERIKHLYLRDLNEEIYEHFSKETVVIDYDLSQEERKLYDELWDKYVSEHETEDVKKLVDNKQLIEGSVLRQETSKLMVPRTIELVNKEIEEGNKVIIFCSFDEELYSLRDYYGDKCVFHNGKITSKRKDKALDTFTNDPNVMVFIGNIQSASVGLNLTVASRIVFNSVSFLPSDNQQAEYRILRIGQTKDCKIYYQKFNNTYMDRIFEILEIKNAIIDSVIVDEKNK